MVVRYELLEGFDRTPNSAESALRGSKRLSPAYCPPQPIEIHSPMLKGLHLERGCVKCPTFYVYSVPTLDSSTCRNIGQTQRPAPQSLAVQAFRRANQM